MTSFSYTEKQLSIFANVILNSDYTAQNKWIYRPVVLNNDTALQPVCQIIAQISQSYKYVGGEDNKNPQVMQLTFTKNAIKHAPSLELTHGNEPTIVIRS